jgi:hypothetical protein
MQASADINKAIFTTSNFKLSLVSHKQNSNTLLLPFDMKAISNN